MRGTPGKSDSQFDKIIPHPFCYVFKFSDVRKRQKRKQTSAELSHSLKVSDRRRNTPKSVQNRSESLCAGCLYRAGYAGLDLAQLKAQIRVEIKDFRPDPCCSGPF